MQKTRDRFVIGVKFVLGLSIASLILSSCGQTDTAPEEETATQPESAFAWPGPLTSSGGTLTIAAPPGYAERGETKPGVDWVTPFEQATGCKVNVVTFNRAEQGIQYVKDGGYDVIGVPSEATGKLFASGLMQPINTELLSNFKEIVPALKKAPWNTFDSVTYGVSDGRGANLLQYHSKVIKGTPNSWLVLWDPQTRYAGQISILDTPMHFADAAVYLMTSNPELGITDPYSLDADQFAFVRDLALQQKTAVGEYWADYAQQLEQFKAKNMVIGDGWQVTQNLAEARNIPVKVTKPKEGVTGWSLTWMIPATASSPNCAYKWIDWLLSSETNAQLAEWVGQAPANLGACILTDDPTHCQIYRARDASFWKDVYVWRTPETDCLDGRTEVECVPYDEWNRNWYALRATG
jgi:putative spermidine/putrescine transport system substrate-binding protein